MRVKKLTTGFTVQENSTEKGFTNKQDLKDYLYSKVDTMVDTLSGITPEVEITMAVDTTPSGS